MVKELRARRRLPTGPHSPGTRGRGRAPMLRETAAALPALAQLHLLPASREGVWWAGPWLWAGVQGQGLQPGARRREWPSPPSGPLQAGRPTRDGEGAASRAKKGQRCSGAGATGENPGRATGSPTPATVSLLWAQEKEGSRWAFAASPSSSCTLLGSPGPLPCSGGGRGLSAKPASPPPGSEISLGNRKSLSNSAACLFCSLNRAPLSWAVGNNLPQELGGPQGLLG